MYIGTKVITAVDHWSNTTTKAVWVKFGGVYVCIVQ